jgi:ABC-2 type transport system permease protein
MNKIGRFFIRVTAFLGKEIFAVLRQPMLVLTLVLGPFLILLLFGVGFRTDPRALRTLFVVSEGSGLAEQVEEYATSLGPQLVFMGVTSDPAEATERLLRNEIDLIAVIPSDAYELIRNSEPATFELRHDEIDPFQVDYINIFGRLIAWSYDFFQS